jgi:uncharacterized damage-inducible protein DinB
MMFSSIGQLHLRYHKWANSQIMEECLKLTAEQLVKDFGGSFGSIYDTAKHLYQADFVWLDRLEAQPTHDLSRYEAPGCTFELRDAWAGVQDKLIAFGAALGETDWEREISYKNTRGDAFKSSIWQIVLQVVNHGTYHRGQITNLLRMSGAKPVNLDLIRFYRD